MTTVFKTQSRRTGDGSEVGEDRLHPTKNAAIKHAGDQRQDGWDTTIYAVRLKSTGIGKLSRKALLCGLFNREGFVETIEVVKTVKGLRRGG